MNNIFTYASRLSSRLIYIIISPGLSRTKGFPPKTLKMIANLFNESSVNFFVCYRDERTITETYGFQVNFQKKISVSMSGSSEKKTAYVYIRRDIKQTRRCMVKLQDFDQKFQQAYKTIGDGHAAVKDLVNRRCTEFLGARRVTRPKKRRRVS